MKSSFVIGALIATVIAIIVVFHFVHPLLIMTLGDILAMILFDVVVSYFIALYLGYDKGKNAVMFWTIIGATCLPISIIAAVVKYNRSSKD